MAGGELVSQAARSKKSILISDIPADYVKVASGLGEALPRYVLVVPLLEGRRLKGVIELGSFGTFSDEQIAEIETLVQPIAAAIAAKQGAEKIQSLLTATQRQAMELVAANEQLEAKSTDLKQQKAEIQERNMELEVAGREIEEQARDLTLSSKYKTDFLANMSHEIRTPMTAM